MFNVDWHFPFAKHAGCKFSGEIQILVRPTSIVFICVTSLGVSLRDGRLDLCTLMPLIEARDRDDVRAGGKGGLKVQLIVATSVPASCVLLVPRTHLFIIVARADRGGKNHVVLLGVLRERGPVSHCTSECECLCCKIGIKPIKTTGSEIISV